MGKRIRKVAFSLWLLASLTFLLLASLLTHGPRLVAAALLNHVNLAREWAMLSASIDNHHASALLPASDDDLELLWKAYNLNPTSTTVRRKLAYALFSREKINESLALLDRGPGNIAPITTPITNDERPETWLLSACLVAKKGQADEAIRQWRRGADLAVIKWSADQYRLVELAGAKVYQYLLEQQPDRLDWCYLRARMLWRIGEREQTIQENTILANLVPQTSRERSIVGEAFFMLGLSSQEDPLVAMEYLEHAIEFNPRLVAAYPILESIYTKIGKTGLAAAVRENLGLLTPQWPAVDGKQEISPGWTFYGYDLQTQEGEEQPLLRLQLYWRLPAGTKPEGSGWYLAGDHWIQVVETYNLATNAGFEQGFSISANAPIGYEIYDNPPPSSSQKIVSIQREGVASQVFQQTTSPIGPVVGAWLKPLFKVTAEYYFLAAWVRSTTPHSASGRFEWFNSQEVRIHKGGDPIENYPLISNIESDQFAQIQVVLPGAYWFKFSLVNRTEDAEWDDIVLLPIYLQGSK